MVTLVVIIGAKQLIQQPFSERRPRPIPKINVYDLRLPSLRKSFTVSQLDNFAPGGETRLYPPWRGHIGPRIQNIAHG